MSRYAPSSTISYSFGPGPITFAVKWIIIVNVAVFVVTTFTTGAFEYFGLIPERVIERGWIWQLVTYIESFGGSFTADFGVKSLEGDRPSGGVAPEARRDSSR